MSSKGNSSVEVGRGAGLVPKLRFPEFEEAKGWSLQRLGEICKLYQPETIPSSEFVTDGKYLVYGANGVVGRIDRYNHEHAEVAISCRGYCGVIHFTEPYSWVTGNAMIATPSGSDLSKAFLYRLLGASDLAPVVTGSAQPQITRQGLSKFVVALPVPAEQQKIADCLDSMDALIAAQGRKVEALRAHKKGLMQQLFPQEGETQPRLRFSEFEGAGEWEEKAVGDFGQVVTGSTPSTADPTLYGGGIPFVSPADISDPRYVDETRTTLTAAGFAKTRPIRAGSVLFVCIGSTIGKIAQNVRDCATNQQINAVIPNAKHSDGFVYFALSNASKRIALLAGKQAVPIINKSLFSAVRLLVPRLPEQKRISDCLTTLDDLIAAETRKLDTLKTHKKGLMQQLFPSVGEADV